MKRKPSPHGTHSRYSHGCRCVQCREAHKIYERDRLRHKARVSYGFERPTERFIEAKEAMLHLQFLQRNGMGLLAVSRASGVASSCLKNVRQGKKKRILVTTHDRIMGVSLADRPDGHFIDPAPSKKLLQELLDVGFIKADLGRALGDSTGHLVVGSKIRVYRAKQIEALHGSLVRKARDKIFVKGSLP
jgi:hypothetical protein